MVPVYEPRVLVATSCLGELLRASVARSSTFINKSVRFFSLLSVPIPSIAFSFISFFLLCFHPFLSLFPCFLSFVVAKKVATHKTTKKGLVCLFFLFSRLQKKAHRLQSLQHETLECWQAKELAAWFTSNANLSWQCERGCYCMWRSWCCLRKPDIACSPRVLATSVLDIDCSCYSFSLLCWWRPCLQRCACAVLVKSLHHCCHDSSNLLKIFAKRRDVHLCCIMWHIGKCV